MSGRRLRNRLILLVMCIVSILTVSAQIAADRPRVLVVPFANLTGQEQNDVVANTSTDTIELTLRLLDQYQVVADTGRTSEALMDAPVTVLRQIATAENVDNIIFGSVRVPEEGGFLFELSVYDRAGDEISLRSESRSSSLFGVFDASDQLVTDAVSGFSGMRIGFGSLRITDEGTGDFFLYVDGSRIGENPSTVERLLIGERDIEIRQVRGDRETLIYRQAVTIRENETAEIRFAFPVVTDDEVAREGELRTHLMEALAIGADVAAIDRSIRELEALYRRVPGALQGSAADLDFYRNRRELSVAMQEISQIDLRSLARRSGSAQRIAAAELIDPWQSLWDTYVEAEERGNQGSSSYSLSVQQEAVRHDVRRNLEVLHARVAMERALVTAEADYQLLDGYNSLRRVLLPLNRPPLRSFTWATEAARADEAFRDYQRADTRQRPVWHWIAGTIGLGGLGYAAYGTFIADTAGLERQIEDSIIRYEQSTDLDEIKALRAEIDGDVDRLNRLETIPRYAGIGGGVFLSTALVGRGISRTRPSRVWRRYRADPFIDRWTAAGFDFHAAREDADGTYLVVLGSDQTFRLESGDETLVTPYVIAASPAQSWEIEHVSARPNELETYRFSTASGVTVVMLGVEP